MENIATLTPPEFQAYCLTCDPRYNEKVLHRGTEQDCKDKIQSHKDAYGHMVALFPADYL